MFDLAMLGLGSLAWGAFLASGRMRSASAWLSVGGALSLSVAVGQSAASAIPLFLLGPLLLAAACRLRTAERDALDADDDAQVERFLTQLRVLRLTRRVRGRSYATRHPALVRAPRPEPGVRLGT